MTENNRRVERKATSYRAASQGRTSAQGSSAQGSSARRKTVVTTRTVPQRRKPSSGKAGIRPKASGSSYKRAQAKKAAMLDRLRKIGLILLATVVLFFIIFFIVNGSKLKNVGNLKIESAATSQTLRWTGAKKGLDYEIYQAIGDGDYVLLGTLYEGENSTTFDSLEAGTLYKYKIVTVKKQKKTDGAYAESYTTPNVATEASAITLSKDSLTVSWNLKGRAEAFEIKYGLYENLRDAKTISIPYGAAKYNPDTEKYSYQIPDLVLDETYYISVRAVCDESAADWCGTFNGTVTRAVDMTGVDITGPMVALTFDDGPDYEGNTERILDTLKAYGGHATFFQLGDRSSELPQIVQRIVDDGNEIGNHTYDHTHTGGEVTADDIIRANNAIEEACGVRPVAFRCPGGEITDAIIDTCINEGMSIYNWNFDTKDWATRDAYNTFSLIQEWTEDGDIILLHSIYEETASAIEEIVPWLVGQGYQLVTVSQMIQAKTSYPPVPGTEYFTAFTTH